MRPTKLTISAFGPYADEVTIDFEQLGREGIYLICGDTGAGKTTIFDAICYALFGSASGQDRSERTLRSDFADPDTPTFVELVFTYRGNTYTIRRSPRYQRPKKRGVGTTEEDPKVCFERPDKPALTKRAEVDAAMTELLGIDRTQFGQIVMIAQGDFRRLLSASTNDRRTIFRRLFGTEAYQRFQNALEDERKALYGRVRNAETQVAALTEQLRPQPGSEDEADLIELRDRNALTAQALLELAQRLVAADEPSLQDTEATLHATEKRIDALAREEERGLAAERLRNELAAAQSEHARLTQLEPELEQKLAQAEAALPDRDEAAARATLLKDALNDYRDHASAQRTAENARRALDDAQSRLASAKEQRDKLDEARRDTAARIESLADARVLLAQAQTALNEAERAQQKADELVALHQDLHALREELDASRAMLAKRKADVGRLNELLASQESALAAERSRADDLDSAPAELEAARSARETRSDELNRTRERLRALCDAQDAEQTARAEKIAAAKAYRQASAQAERAQARYAALNKAFLDGQAGILASSLKEGMPCPVCGSLSHPAPAACEASTPSQSEIDAAEAERARGEQAAANAAAEAATARALHADRARAVEALIADHGDEQALFDREQKASDNLEGARAQEAQARKRTEELAELRGLIATHEQEVVKLRQRITNASASVTELTADCSAQMSRCEVLEAQTQGIDETSAHAAAQAAANSAQQARNAVDARSADARELDLLNKRHEQIEHDILALDLEVDDARNHAESCAREARVAEAKRDIIALRLPYPTQAEALSALSAADATVDRIDSAVSQARSSLERHKRAEEAAAARSASLADQVDAAQSIDLGSVASKRAEIQATYEELKSTRDTLRSRIEANTAVARQLETINARSQADMKAYAEIAPVAFTAAGTLAGHDRITFETYVQTLYFDRMINAANRRLSVMTTGRYELVRRTKAISRSEKSGLDLDVIDHYTGKERDASSLSGGEAFKASLALALGLSDVVQAHAGGIQLDTMFIDEGFGSLDTESLGLAIKTLTELTGSGKLVGIISHVDELKESIDRKIIVSRSHTGSTLKIEA